MSAYVASGLGRRDVISAVQSALNESRDEWVIVLSPRSLWRPARQRPVDRAALWTSPWKIDSKQYLFEYWFTAWTSSYVQCLGYLMHLLKLNDKSTIMWYTETVVWLLTSIFHKLISFILLEKTNWTLPQHHVMSDLFACNKSHLQKKFETSIPKSTVMFFYNLLCKELEKILTEDGKTFISSFAAILLTNFFLMFCGLRRVCTFQNIINYPEAPQVLCSYVWNWIGWADFCQKQSVFWKILITIVIWVFKQHNIWKTIGFFDKAYGTKNVSFWPYNRYSQGAGPRRLDPAMTLWQVIC